MTVDDWRVKYEILSAETDRLRAERDAARAGEARAVEALQNLRIPLAQLGDFMYSPVRDASQELLVTVNSVLANTYTQPALDWLAQQRAEAAEEAREEFADRPRLDHPSTSTKRRGGVW